MIKYTLPALCAALLFTSCAGVRVADTQVAAVVTERPNAIYIRPFSVEGAEFTGYHPGGPGARPIEQSKAPAEFAIILKDELEKLAPVRVLRSDERATQGWLVEGSLEVVDAGVPAGRAAFLPQVNPLGRSRIVAHVRVTDLGSPAVASDDKDSGTLRRRGQVIYEFDISGGSRLSGPRGSIYAPG
ncbi:MAG: hypothetical protein EOP84_08230, partial [Verrucomicrobiaceae bacterium]